MYDDSNPVIRRLRAICLALPEAFEKEAWGECTFRVTGGSMFAMTDNNHHRSNHIAVWIKAPRDLQEMLVSADAKRFFVPPYVGSKGWIGVRQPCKDRRHSVGQCTSRFCKAFGRGSEHIGIVVQFLSRSLPVREIMCQSKPLLGVGDVVIELRDRVFKPCH